MLAAVSGWCRLASALVVLLIAAATASGASADVCSNRASSSGSLQSLCDRLAEARQAGETTVEFDFGGAEVPAADLADLIVSWNPDIPHVLNELIREGAPAKLLHELTLRNVVVDGEFELRNADVIAALEFDNAVFVNRKEHITPETCDQPVPADEEAKTVVLIRDTNLKKRLSFIDSRVCGRLLIKDSRLEGGLTVAGKVFDWSIPPEEQTHSLTDVRALYVAASAIDSSVVLHSVRFPGSVEFRGNSLRSFTPLNVDHAAPFKLNDNRIGRVEVWHATYREGMAIRHNQIDGAFRLYTSNFLGQNIPRIRDNSIDGEMRITLREVSSSRFDLAHNSASTLSEIWLPGQWRGALDLAGARFSGTLKLFNARFDTDNNKLKPIFTKKNKKRSTYCPRYNAYNAEHHTLVIMSFARIANLAWNLPLTCKYRWRGAGLTYTYWGDRDDWRVTDEGSPGSPPEPDRGAIAAEAAERPTGESGEQNGEDVITQELLRWRYQMDEVDSAPLRNLTQYLSEHGRLTESRDIALEVGRINYVGADSLYEYSVWDSRWWSVHFGGSVAGYLTWPVGYGAKPGRALILLSALWLVCYAIYKVYSVRSTKEWDRLDWNGTRTAGFSRTPGFRQFAADRRPRRFSLLQYSFDATLPVISLHAYDSYYPQHQWMRLVPVFQHVLGWYLITLFLVFAVVL